MQYTSLTSDSRKQESSSKAIMYIACLLLPSLATCWGVHRNEDDTEGTVSVLVPAPVDCRNWKRKSSFPPIGVWNTDRTSSSTSVTLIEVVSLIFPIRPFSPSLVRYLPRGKERGTPGNTWIRTFGQADYVSVPYLSCLGTFWTTCFTWRFPLHVGW